MTVTNARPDNQSALARPGSEAPEGYDASKYPPFFCTVDFVLFTMRDGVLSVLLVERSENPFAGYWALTGGFVEIDEDIEAAVWRELGEETGFARKIFETAGHLEQLRTYGGPKRDRRGRIVSVAHVALAPNLPDPVAGSDAKDARWWAVYDVLGNCDGCVNGYRIGPDGRLIDSNGIPYGECEMECGFEGPRLAFDHVQIVVDGLERIRSKIEYTTLALQFVAEPLTAPEIKRVYEAVWNEAVDLSNLRRKLVSAGAIIATGERGLAPDVTGPKPLLFLKGPGTVLHPPILRPSRDPSRG